MSPLVPGTTYYYKVWHLHQRDQCIVPLGLNGPTRHKHGSADEMAVRKR